MTKVRGPQYVHVALFVFISYFSPVSAKGKIVSLVFVGDVAFDGTYYYQDKHGYCSYNQTFELVAQHLQNSDLTIGNLEATFVPEDMVTYEQEDFEPRLRNEPKSVFSLKYAGFDIMGLNNNHLTDFQEKPINFTISLLNKIGIKAFGYTYGTIKENKPQVPLIVDVKGVKIGFLGYCDILKIVNAERFHYTCIIRQANGTAGPPIYTDENASRDVNRLKKKVDIVVVSLHWGVENQKYPSESQLRVYLHLKSLGVHLVIGSHPHVLQAHTISKFSFTAFSLGNFIFGPTDHFKIHKFYYHKDPPAKVFKSFMKYVKSHRTIPSLQSRILRVLVNKKGFVAAQYLPVRIGFDPSMPNFKCFRPRPLEPIRWIHVCRKDDKQCLRTDTEV